MNNPYQSPDTSFTEKRVFKTPIITPLSIVTIIAIYFGYGYYQLSDMKIGVLEILKHSAFGIFMLCQFGLISLILYNERQINLFLKKYPVITNSAALLKLRPIVRTNMYSALFIMFFLALSAVTAIMTMTTFDLVKLITVVIFSLCAGIALMLYNPLEKKLKQIECTNKEIDNELNKLLHCWQQKAFPDF